MCRASAGDRMNGVFDFDAAFPGVHPVHDQALGLGDGQAVTGNDDDLRASIPSLAHSDAAISRRVCPTGRPPPALAGPAKEPKMTLPGNDSSPCTSRRWRASPPRQPACRR